MGIPGYIACSCVMSFAEYSHQKCGESTNADRELFRDGDSAVMACPTNHFKASHALDAVITCACRVLLFIVTMWYAEDN